MAAEDLLNSSHEKWQDVGFAAHWSAIAAIEVICVTSIVLNLAVANAIIKNPVLFKSYAFLCAAQSTSDALGLLIHAAITIPTFAIRDMSDDRMLDLAAIFVSGVGVTLLYHQMVILCLTAYSRYIAVAKPLFYESLFTIKKCWILVGIGFLYSALCTVTYWWCPLWFDTEHYFLTYQLDGSSWPCGYTTMINAYMAGTPVYSGAIYFTIRASMQLRAYWKRQVDAGQSEARKELRKKQQRAMKETTYNCIIQISLMPVYNVLTPILAKHDFKLVCLFTGVGSWVLLHSVNTVIMLVNNSSVREFLFCRKKPAITPVKKLKTQIAHIEP